MNSYSDAHGKAIFYKYARIRILKYTQRTAACFPRFPGLLCKAKALADAI